MTGLFGTLNTANKGLTAQQTALQTIGHNVSNANTAGYSRQRVTMQADFAQNIAGVGQVGTGVRVSSVDRVSDHFINTQLRNAHSTTQRHTSLADTIGQLEAIFNEPSDSGLSNQISEVFNAWNYLASNPEQSSAKTMLIQTTETFTDTIKHMSDSMDRLHEDTLGELNKAALDVNSTLEQLDRLNDQIWQASVRGFTPNDLLDQQDRLLNDIAGNMDITVERDKFNRVSVETNNQVLLNSTTRQTVSVVTEANDQGFEIGSVVVTAPDSDEPTLIQVEKGVMRGEQDALNVIDNAKSQLDDFALTFANAVNFIHSDNGEGSPFFNIDESNPSSSIRVTDELRQNPEYVVTGASLTNEYTGDGTRAQAIASLQNTPLPTDNWSFSDDGSMQIVGDGPSSTLFDRYNSLVTDIGIVKQKEDNMLETQSALMQLLSQRRESVSGVDINEEVVDMIKYSSAFQANSRVLQTISEMIDTLINRTGV